MNPFSFNYTYECLVLDLIKIDIQKWILKIE